MAAGEALLSARALLDIKFTPRPLLNLASTRHKMIKALCVAGARPNFIKVAALLNAFQRQPVLDTMLVHTGQHYDASMSATFFRELNVPAPNAHLGVGPGRPDEQISEIIRRLEPILAKWRPDVLIAVGDVNSTLAATLAARELNIPVAHVEAGLRSFDRSMPEELNRIVVDRLSTLFFASEASGVRNLLLEGRPPQAIFLVGNVMIDTLRCFLSRARRSSIFTDLDLAPQAPAGTRRYALVTLHRAATVDDPERLLGIWRAIEDLARETPVIFPVHPRTASRLRQAGLPADRRVNRSLHVVPPLGYLPFLRLQSEATMVITDSGGVQEETTALGVPCLTVRENTERPVTVTEGTNTVVGVDPEGIRRVANEILAGRAKHGRVPYLWDGHAAERIARILVSLLQPTHPPFFDPLRPPFNFSHLNPHRL
jgi:UDP-N-acetylglucosamine 2-epimerase (non-hydrolysing)